MGDAVSLFVLLMAAHAVADFGLQSDWIAKNKRTSRMVRLMHSLIHGGAAYAVTLDAAVLKIETGLHYFIDSVTLYGKRPPLWVDQMLHAICKAFYVAAIIGRQP